MFAFTCGFITVVFNYASLTARVDAPRREGGLQSLVALHRRAAERPARQRLVRHSSRLQQFQEGRGRGAGRVAGPHALARLGRRALEAPEGPRVEEPRPLKSLRRVRVDDAASLTEFWHPPPWEPPTFRSLHFKPTYLPILNVGSQAGAPGALSPKLWLLSPRLHGCATARSALLGVLQLLLRGLGALDGGARRLRSWQRADAPTNDAVAAVGSAAYELLDDQIRGRPKEKRYDISINAWN